MGYPLLFWVHVTLKRCRMTVCFFFFLIIILSLLCDFKCFLNGKMHENVGNVGIFHVNAFMWCELRETSKLGGSDDWNISFVSVKHWYHVNCMFNDSLTTILLIEGYRLDLINTWLHDVTNTCPWKLEK